MPPLPKHTPTHTLIREADPQSVAVGSDPRQAWEPENQGKTNKFKNKTKNKYINKTRARPGQAQPGASLSPSPEPNQRCHKDFCLLVRPPPYYYFSICIFLLSLLYLTHTTQSYS